MPTLAQRMITIWVNNWGGADEEDSLVDPEALPKIIVILQDNNKVVRIIDLSRTYTRLDFRH